ncbi:MAG: hypothetical protein KIT57_10025 [Blastocatellales bacterium]|nr:hypothetical protein [Blastocatellales bacterium]
MTNKHYLSLLIGGAIALAGCSTPPAPVESTPTPAASGGGSTIAVGHGAPAASAPAGDSAPPAASAAGDGPGNAGGIKWTAPKNWSLGPERSMRAATYLIPAAGGDAEGGECAVFFFGPGQGGGVQANIDRWIGQFEQPDGSSSTDKAKQNREVINGLAVTTVDLTGTFAGGGPMMGGDGGKKTGYRMLGAIVEGPQGAVFFKLTGPVATVGAAQNDFRALLKSLGS